MIEHELDIRTADGATNTFITHPQEGGPFPVVLFYMDAHLKTVPGLRYRIERHWERLFALFKRNLA